MSEVCRNISLCRNLVKYAMGVEKSRKYKNKFSKIMRVCEKLQ